MKKIFFDNKINFLFLFIAFLCVAGVVGVENISFQNTKWLHYRGETSLVQMGWYFFLNDVWRFPLGNNPNYGGGFGSSIVFSDSLPLLAFFFKSIKSFIPGNFQYVSFWYLVCFYLQLFFSFKILNKFTNSVPYSLIGSIFFLISPIFIYRVNWLVAESSHWILLFALYLALTRKVDQAKWTWIFLIILSSLVNYNFTVMTLVAYSLLRVFNFYFEKESFFKFIKDFFIIFVLLLLTLYIVGYFEVRMVDTLGIGFGYYKLNLLSIFDPVNAPKGISWSWFLPDIKLTRGEELEGFNYFGLGQIMMLLFVFVLFFNKNYRANIFSIKNSKEIKTFILISFFFTIWALSNKISFGSITLLEIPLNKYIFAAFSVAKHTGRLFWIVNYFLLILSIIIIYQCFKQKNSLLIIILFLIIQIADTSAGLKTGLKNRINFLASNESVGITDKIWDDLFKRYKIVKTTYPISWSPLLKNFSYFMEKHKTEKTNLVILARINRKTIAEARYRLYDNFRKKNLSSDTIYLIDNLGHLRHLKYLFKNENISFFYRDNLWAMIMNDKEKMNDNDKKKFKKINPKLLKINEKKSLYFEDKDNYYGFGWSHNFNKLGIWSEGQTSTLLFRTEKNYENLKLEIFCEPYVTRKNKILEIDIYTNNSFNKNIKLGLVKNNLQNDKLGVELDEKLISANIESELEKNNSQDQKIEILLDGKFIKNNEITIDFSFKNPISPYEVFESPDSRKLGILIKSVKIIPI